MGRNNKKIRRETPIKNQEMLKQSFIEEWQKVIPEFTNKLIKALPKRPRAIT